MALTQIILGRKRSTPDAGFGTIPAGGMRLFIPNTQPKNLWLVGWGWSRAGTQGGPTVAGRFAAYATDGSRNPTSRLGYSDIVNLTASMTGFDAGDDYFAGVAHSDTTPSDKGVKVPANTYPALGWVGTNGTTGHGMLASNDLPSGTTDHRFFTQAGANSPPPSSYGGPAGTIEGHMSLYAECYENEPPRVPVNRSPSGTINDLNPTFEADFRDRNGVWGTANDGVDAGDLLYRVRLRLYNASGAQVWSKTYTATSGERTAGRSSYAYDGPALSRNVAYSWDVAHYDDFNEAGEASAPLSFTVAGGPLATLDGSPTGTVQAINPPNFQFRYHHTAATAGTHYQLALYNASTGTLVKESGQRALAMTSSAAPGTLYTETWASVWTGVTAPTLAPGVTYVYKVRLRDSAGLWSSYPDTGRTFKIDAAPSVPAPVSPPNAQTFTNLGKLTVVASDADDTVATGLGVTGKIYLAGVQQGATKTFTLRAGTTDTWDYQLQVGDIAAGNTYTWDTIAFDGTFWSGPTGATSEGAGTRSAARSFTYSAGVAVVPTFPAPGQVVADGSPLITWTGSFNRKRVTITRTGTAEVIWGNPTGPNHWEISSVGEMQVPDGALRDGDDIDILIEVLSAGDVYGAASIDGVQINYDTVAPPAYLVATPVPVGRDIEASSVDLEWGLYGGDLAYAWALVYASYEPKGPIAKITDPNLNRWRDYNAPWGLDVEYSVRHVVWNNKQRRASDYATATARIEFSGILLHAKDAPTDERLILPAWRSRKHVPNGEETLYQLAGAEAPVTVRSRKLWQVTTVVIPIADLEGVSGRENRVALEALIKRGGPLLYRDGYGRRRWVTIPRNGNAIEDLRNERYDVTLQLRDEHVEEGLPT